MRAVLWTKYGAPDLLKLGEVPKPIPKDNEVLIRIYAATVTAGDCELRKFDITFLFWLPVRLFMGIFKPRIKILGQELAGEIESVGKEVTQFKKGDRVCAPADMTMGAYAEYKCLPITHPMTVIPSNVTYDEAATIPTGGLNALHFLRKADIRSEEKVLINGAGGSIGTYAIQLAKSYGAEVTSVDHATKLSMLRSIGSDHIIDYTQEDFVKNGNTYDVIIDITNRGSFSRIVKSLKPHGRFVICNPSLSGMVLGLWTSLTSDKIVINALANYEQEDLNLLIERMKNGQLKSVVDKCYPLEEIAKAHNYVETGLKAGHVVININ